MCYSLQWSINVRSLDPRKEDEPRLRSWIGHDILYSPLLAKGGYLFPYTPRLLILLIQTHADLSPVPADRVRRPHTAVTYLCTRVVAMLYE